MDIKVEFKKIGRPIWSHPVLNRIARGQVTTTQMQDFVLQRHTLTEGFVALLEVIIQATDDVDLQNCIVQNLGDETGHGVETDSHASWRADYLHALGLSPPYVAPLLPGTLAYNKTLSELLSSRDVLACAGALLLLERTIPPEFAHIRRGLEKLFPNTFRLQPGDSTAERLQKQRARLYLVDHEHHDARYHEPDLRHALSRHFVDGCARQAIVSGAELVATAKINFYDSIAEYFGR